MVRDDKNGRKSGKNGENGLGQNPHKRTTSRLNSRPSVKKTWDMIRKINGKNSSWNVGHLNVRDDVTSKADIADALADTFAEKSSSCNYSTAFQKFQNSKEKIKLNFKSNNNEHYNKTSL